MGEERILAFCRMPRLASKCEQNARDEKFSFSNYHYKDLSRQ